MTTACGKLTLSGAPSMVSRFLVRWLCLVSLALSLGACQYEPSPMAKIGLTFERPDTCRMVVAGQTFILSSEASGALAALRREATKFPNASVGGNTSMPYRCVGHAIFLAQRAGFERVGFIAEASPPTANP